MGILHADREAQYEYETIVSELEQEAAEEWFWKAAQHCKIVFYAETLATMLDIMKRLRATFPKAELTLDFTTTEDRSCTVSNISDAYALEIAQAVAEMIVWDNITAKQADEEIEGFAIEHMRKYQ